MFKNDTVMVLRFGRYDTKSRFVSKESGRVDDRIQIDANFVFEEGALLNLRMFAVSYDGDIKMMRKPVSLEDMRAEKFFLKTPFGKRNIK